MTADFLLASGCCLLGYRVIGSLRQRVRLEHLRLEQLRLAGVPIPGRGTSMQRSAQRRSGGEAAGLGENPQEVLLAILASTSARLGAGASPQHAWEPLTAGDPSADKVELGLLIHKMLPRPDNWHASSTALVIDQAVAQIVAADDLARIRGMSLARLLARVQESLETELELHTAQVAALTPARTSARLLQLLPVLGLALGTVLGFNPFVVLLGSLPGRLCLIGAIGCVVAGQVWSRTLLRRALLPAAATRSKRTRG